MSKIGIVCDSTCDLGPEWLAEHNVAMVPLKVLFGDETYRDWVDMRPDEFLQRLTTSPVLPKTSQPSPAEFETAFRELAEAGCDGIVSVHLTAALSGTHQSASIAAESSPIPVRIIDTRQVSSGTAMAVKMAIEARDAGGDLEAVAEAAQYAADNTRFFFVLDTLDYLVKGGRAGKAAGLAATLLGIKPILRFDANGEIEPFAKVRGVKKALQTLSNHIAEDAAGRTIRLGLLHASHPELVEELRAAIVATGVEIVHEPDVLLGAVIGTYAGPGAIGAAYLPMR